MQTTNTENIRHSFAHLTNIAVRRLYPKAQPAIGPAIENGFYQDFGNVKITTEDLPRIEKEIRKVAAQNLSFSKELWPVRKVLDFYKKEKQPYKVAIAKDLVKEQKLTKLGIVKTGDLLVDLCRGGHIKNTKELSLDAFKLTSVAGAYWRGSEKNPMLTRIYGVAFSTKKELDQYLWQQEEAKKRDHRKLGKELDLFTFSDLVGPGLPLWTPKGTAIREELEKFAKQTEEKWGYKRIATPHIARRKLYETSGHLGSKLGDPGYYGHEMFPGMDIRDRGDQDISNRKNQNKKGNSKDEGNIFRYYLKGMNCPMTMAMFGQKSHSYREFPVRLAEYGTVYRYEPAGVLDGLLRVRGFTQNDAHIFCREDQVGEEFINVMKLHEYYYRDVFGIKDYYVRLSLRDRSKKDKFGGNDTTWKKAESIIRSAIKKSGVPFQEAVGEASFYGPKADFQIKSVIGKEETASTNQIDFIMPKRFGLTYAGEDSKKHDVVVIHRAPLGSHERFIAFLIEHYAGAFPLWLSPEQIWILPISDKFIPLANKVAEKLKAESKENLRLVVKSENETLGKKIREGELQKIPYLLIVGEREAQNNAVSVRQRGKGDLGQMSTAEFSKKVEDEIKMQISE